MTRYTQNGLTLWYGTEDAPAPLQGETPRGDVAITIAVQPPHPSNRVVIRYRIAGGAVKTLSAILTSTDYAGATQYFRAVFTDLPSGAAVHYSPVVMCGGRQAPDVATAATLPASFRYESVPTLRQAPAVDTEYAAHEDRFPFRKEFLCTVTLTLDRKAEIVGETPEGFKVDWYVTGGRMAGPRLNGVVRAEGGDWMTIRRDGIGTMDARTTLETCDGALIAVSETGVVDLGEDGFRNFRDGKWPPTPTVRSSPRFLTAHPNYLWLNRLQCLGVGMVRMNELLVTYDVYAVH